MSCWKFIRRKPKSSKQNVVWSVVKYGGQSQSGQAIKLFQAPGKKIVLPSILDTTLSFLMMWNLQSYPTTVLNERMWHFFFGGLNILWPSYIFSGLKPRNDLRTFTGRSCTAVSVHCSCPIDASCRSCMNISIRIGREGNEALEKKFVTEAAREGMIHLNGHRYQILLISYIN